jgi:glutathione S-transferase
MSTLKGAVDADDLPRAGDAVGAPDLELGLSIEIKPVDFAAAYRDTPEWRAISPTGKLPALTDGELTMFESSAMVDYILDRYGEGLLRPEAGTAARALCQQWSWFSEATLLRSLASARRA